MHYYLSTISPALLAFLEIVLKAKQHSGIQKLQVYSFLVGLILRDDLAPQQVAGLSAYTLRWKVDKALR